MENIAKLLVSVSDLSKSDQSPKRQVSILTDPFIALSSGILTMLTVGRYEDTEIIFVWYGIYTRYSVSCSC